MVVITPPTRPLASKQVTSTPRVRSSSAVLKPVIPAPMTATRSPYASAAQSRGASIAVSSASIEPGA